MSLSNRSPDEAKSHRQHLPWQGPVDLGTSQNTAGIAQPDCPLLFCNIDNSLGIFSVILSIMHGTDVIIPEIPIFSQLFTPKILWELMLFGVSCLGMPAVTSDIGSCPNSVLIGLEQFTPICVNLLC